MSQQINRNVRIWAASLVVLLWITALIVLLPIGSQNHVSAQGNPPPTYTPPPSPTGNGGQAQWTVADSTFKPNFPKGFSFVLKASSTGGKIVEATAFWSHAPGHQRRANGMIDPSGTITATWKRGSGDGVPQWVGVDYWWILKDAAGNLYQTNHQYDEYADTTHVWHRAESEDIIVFWEDGLPDKIGTEAIDAMRQQRPFYLQNWGKLLTYRPRAILYKSRATFAEWDSGTDVVVPGSTQVVGLSSPEWGGTAQVYVPRYGIESVAYSTVPHEVGHLYQFANGGSSGLPSWFIEGDATYFEARQDYDYLQRVKDMAASGDLPTLQESGPVTQGRYARDGYDIGYAFFVWLHDTYGPDAHLKVWTLITQGQTFHQALETVTSTSFIDMETAFRTWLGASNPVAPTPMPTEAFEFPPTPTYEPTPTPSS